MKNSIIFVTLFYCFASCFAASEYYNSEECGIVNALRPGGLGKHKIMGGTDTNFDDYPFTVAIYKDKKYICTGTLISQRHVVTAAHCFAGTNPVTYIQEKCGNADQKCVHEFIGDEKPSERCQTNFQNSTSIIASVKVGYGSHKLGCAEYPMEMLDLEAIDPGYIQFFQSGCYENDLAILTLAPHVNESQRPYACLSFATDIDLYDDLSTFVLGWGKDPILGVESHAVLQKLETGVVFSMKNCQKSWQFFPPDCICVKEEDDKDACDGDSGGPLLTEFNRRMVLLGILSFGTNCDRLRANYQAKTAAFTRMDFHQQRLSQIIGWENENLDGFTFRNFTQK